MYAFRSWPSSTMDDSSAEWSEAMALELGDRVSAEEFSQIMAQAFAEDLFLHGWMS